MVLLKVFAFMKYFYMETSKVTYIFEETYFLKNTLLSVFDVIYFKIPIMIDPEELVFSFK